MSLPEIGSEILGKYRIIRKLGEGGMGVVFAATHIELQETVAIKMLAPELVRREEIVARFMREARAASKIKNEHAVRVLDVGKLESGVPYMVMEFLQGEDLEQVLCSRGPLPLQEVVKFVTEACIALSDAHRQGIIHRDIKPANLFLATRSNGTRVVKIVDFGISKIINDGLGEGGATRTDSMMGTPMYMSPEQLRSSRDVDARADVWSLGVVLYRLLTGASPFEGDTVPLLCVSILASNPRKLRELRPDLPAELEVVVANCLEKDRNRRMSSVEELALALTPWASADMGVPSGRSGMISGHWTPGFTGTTGTTGTTDSKISADLIPISRPRPLTMIAIATVTALIIVAGGLFAWKNMSTEAAAKPDVPIAKMNEPSVVPSQHLGPIVEPHVAPLSTTAVPVVAAASDNGVVPAKPSATPTLVPSNAKRPTPVTKSTGTNTVFDVGGRK